MNAKTEKKDRKRGRPFANKDLTAVLEAAAKIFAKKGFDGAQIKEIAEAADFSPSLLRYHFKNKEDLWKKTVKRLGDILLETLKDIGSYFKDLKGITLMKAYNRQFIHFSAKYPEFFKIAFHEIGNESHRADWLMEEVLPATHQQFNTRVIANNNFEMNTYPDIPPAYFHSLIIGSANMFFALSYQVKKQFGIDSFDKEEIDKYADFINDTVFARFE